MATLSFFLCNSKQRGKRIIPRMGKGDTHTQLNGKLNCFAYECSGYPEFQHLQDRLGYKDGWYSGVLVKNDDGTFRLPEANDLVTKTPSPAAPAEAGRVVVTSSQPEEGTFSQSAPEIEVDFELDDGPVVTVIPKEFHDAMADVAAGRVLDLDVVLSISKVREYIETEGAKRLPATAAKFGMDIDALREAIESPGSGLILKQGGWISAPK